MMQEFKGLPIAPGIAVGKIRFLEDGAFPVPVYHVDDIEAELLRLSLALEKAKSDLNKMLEEAIRTTDAGTAQIFRGQLLILSDELFLTEIRSLIRQQQKNAEAALEQVTSETITRFCDAGDPVLISRTADVRDAAESIRAALSEKKGAGYYDEAEEDFILAARNLTPGLLMQCDRTHLRALVTQDDTENSHTAILARAFKLPSLSGIPVTRHFDGKTAALDATHGFFALEPSEQTLDRILGLEKEEKLKQRTLSSLAGVETVSGSGQRLPVYANIASPEELPEVLSTGAEGIGLFRSEFLFLGKEGLPDEETQFLAYRRVLDAMGEKEVVIRTIDLGADKELPGYPAEKTENPGLGMRGIRFALFHRELFLTQLRALLRASAYGNLSVLYPMICSVAEFTEAKKLMEAAKKELEAGGIPVGHFRQGVMIETPAAVQLSEELAAEADFFSIGTNDLTQYTLAIDRKDPALISYYDPHHPAVLRQIAYTIRCGHEAGIRVGICGELAADTGMSETFLSYKADCLSVTPSEVLMVRKAILEH